MPPFFSIVLPTKNRSHIIGAALRCVFNQTFTDFEVIVVDNSDDDSTVQVVKGFDDARLRYIRTGGLSMPDNWEAGVREARGEYLTILEDKQLLYARALATIYRAVEKERPLSVNWYVDAINNTNGSACVYSNLFGKLTPETEYFTSQELITRFMATGHYGVLYLLPKGFNSCTHRSLVDRILNGPGGRFCPPVSPDYTTAFVQLAYADRVLRINEALSAIAWAGGNGISLTMKDEKGRMMRFIKEVGAERISDRVPVRSPMIINSIIYNDYINLRDQLGGHLTDVPFDAAQYFVVCFDEIIRRELMGVDMSEEEALWRHALEQQPTAVQASVRHAIKPHIRQRAEHRRAVFMQKTGMKRVIGKVQQITGLSAAALAAANSVPTFPDVLAAVDWEARGEYRGVFAQHNLDTSG